MAYGGSQAERLPYQPFSKTLFSGIVGVRKITYHHIDKRYVEGEKMDPIMTAIVAALSAGATNGLTEVSKTAVTDAYHTLKDLLIKKFGASSEVVRSIDRLEAKPESVGRQETLQEEIVTVNAEQDHEVLAAARHVLALVHPQ